MKKKWNLLVTDKHSANVCWCSFSACGQLCEYLNFIHPQDSDDKKKKKKDKVYVFTGHLNCLGLKCHAILSFLSFCFTGF